MIVDRLCIKNYKGFRDSGWLQFQRGFNVIVGQNNVGKTALLEAFGFRSCEDRPYCGAALPKGIPTNPKSIFEFDALFEKGEFSRLAIGLGPIHIPVPIWGGEASLQSAREVLAANPLRIQCVVSPSGSYEHRIYPSHGQYVGGAQGYAVELVTAEDRQSVKIGNAVNSKVDSMAQLLNSRAEQCIYVFKPERLNLGTCDVRQTDILSPDGRNLPAVLLKLQSNPIRFKRFNDHVISIFPSIHQVVVDSLGSQVSVQLWMGDPASERDELRIRLEESGTGVGQVLAILYVAMTRTSNVIVIDEPNSFLHPGAAKKLVRILKQYDQNQYIISTHSPEVISAADPETLHLVSWNGKESKVEQLDKKSISHMRRVLADVGTSLADVFGAEKIIWVEGQTESECFPKLLPKGSPLEGASFVPLRTTGELESRRSDSRAIWEIYESLSKGLTLVPPALAFSLDREGRSEQEMKDLIRRSGGRMHFLPRAIYENYLIHPACIAAIMTAEANKYDMKMVFSSADIEKWLTENGGRFSDGDVWKGDWWDLNWLRKCDGAKLLSSMFDSLTSARLEYRKLSHSIALTEWLLANQPSHLIELQEYIGELSAKSSL